MADTTNIKNLVVNAGDASYMIHTSDIYEEMGLTVERFAELLARDFYCPLLASAPTESTLTYTDSDGSSNHFSIGQECRVPEEESSEYVFYKFMGTYQGKAVWYQIPSKLSDLDNDDSYVQAEAVEGEDDGSVDREVKDAVVEGERIYFRGHAGATYMSDGRTVEDAIPVNLSSLTNDSGYVNAEVLSSSLPDGDLDRQVKDASLNGSKVYMLGHASATLMSDGRTVEGAVGDMEEWSSFYDGCNKVVSVSSLPVDKRLVVAGISSDASLSLASVPSVGKDIHIMIHNTGSSAIVITLPVSGGYVNTAGSELNIDSLEWAEVNVISDGSTIYIRGI